jgi:putative endonuclease
MQEEPESLWCVYITKCSDNTLYTGITNDIGRRISEHNRGIGAKYTRGRTSVKLVFVETSPNRSAASRREAAIKRMSLIQKQMLIDQRHALSSFGKNKA